MIVGLSTTAGAGSFAYLTDSGTSDFSFLTGSLEVQTTPDTLDFGDIAESTATADVSITNNGSLPARQVQWTGLGISGADAVTVAQAMQIESIEYRGEDVTDGVLDQVQGAGNGNGIFDLDDVSRHLDNDNVDLEGLVGGDGLDPNGNETATLAVTVGVDYSQNITEDNMAMTATVEVTGEQES